MRSSARPQAGSGNGKKLFRAVLIKPSHYDDDGYVIQWVRNFIPSNSLALLYGLVSRCAETKALGDDVEIDIVALDEVNARVEPRKLARSIREADWGFVGLVGVQSNQFPRALDLARTFRELGVAVAMGGFHVSGVLAMLKKPELGLQDALDLGVSLFAGEAEDVIDAFLRDVRDGTMKPVYDQLSNLPDLHGAVGPILPPEVMSRMAGMYGSFDSGRGCPFQCSFCTIINVQGRKSRTRSPDDIARIVKANARAGVTRFFITDDDFARNRNWEAILDRLIELRAEGVRMAYHIQVDVLCHKIPNFIAKCKKAGVRWAFIGLENINSDNLLAVKKKQNRLHEYRDMLQQWKRVGISTMTGYIVGFDADTPERLRRDIEIIKRELPIDLMEILIMTPLPGSEDHKVMWDAGAVMDRDLNFYDLYHAVRDFKAMSREEMRSIYRELYDLYYEDGHIERIMRRNVVSGRSAYSMIIWLAFYYASLKIEHVHPLEAGFIRRKFRTDRRPGLKREHPLVFYPRRMVEIPARLYAWIELVLRYGFIARRIDRDPDRTSYTDLALQPDDAETDAILELEGHTAPARKVVAAQ